MDPYDLKPMGNAKVPVNLKFFLTECNKKKKKITNTLTQTNTFRKIKKSNRYIPKKTGIDIGT